MRKFPDPAAPPGLADRLFADLWVARRLRRRRALGATLATAGVIAALGITLNWTFGSRDLAPTIARIWVPAEVPTAVRLVVSAGHDYAEVQVVFRVPDGFALQGHPGEQRVAWRGRLEAGRNILKLRVLAQPHAHGVLTAVLRRNEVEKTFRFPITTAKIEPGAAHQPSAAAPLRT